MKKAVAAMFLLLLFAATASAATVRVYTNYTGAGDGYAHTDNTGAISRIQSGETIAIGWGSQGRKNRPFFDFNLSNLGAVGVPSGATINSVNFVFNVSSAPTGALTYDVMALQYNTSGFSVDDDLDANISRTWTRSFLNDTDLSVEQVYNLSLGVNAKSLVQTAVSGGSNKPNITLGIDNRTGGSTGAGVIQARGTTDANSVPYLEISYTAGGSDTQAPNYSGVTNSTPAIFAPGAPIWLNATWVDNTSVSQVLVQVDGANKTPTNIGSVYFVLLNGLAAGQHSWVSYANDSAGNFNATGNNTFTIAKAPVSAVAYANSSSTNRSINGLPAYLNLTATKNASEGTVELLYNNTGANMLLNSSSSNTTTFFWTQGNATGYLLSARFNETQNYSSAAAALQLSVTNASDSSKPNYSNNLTTAPSVYAPNASIWLNITWADDSGVAQVLVQVDGANKTPSNNSGVYYVFLGGLAAGQHSWVSYANDSAGNFNATGNNTFNISKAPINITVYADGSPENRSVTSPFTLNLSTTKNASEGIVELLFNNTGHFMQLNYSSLNATSVNYTKFLWRQNNASGYLVYGRFNETQNYSARNSSLQITINASDPLLYAKPIFYAAGRNSSLNGDYTLFHIKITGAQGLYNAIFSFDNGDGAFSNSTLNYYFYNATDVWFNNTVLVNKTAGSLIRWFVWANSSNNYGASSQVFSYNASPAVTTTCAGAFTIACPLAVTGSTLSVNATRVVSNAFYCVEAGVSVTLPNGSIVQPVVSCANGSYSFAYSPLQAGRYKITYSACNSTASCTVPVIRIAAAKPLPDLNALSVVLAVAACALLYSRRPRAKD